MRVAFISPTAYLDICHTGRSDIIHLMLAQEAESLVYHEWYVQAVKRGEHVILDNGAYELGRSIESGTLLKLTEEIKPTEVVCPDVLFDSQGTIEGTRMFLYSLAARGLLQHTKPMVVPQGKNIDEWSTCLAVLVNMCIAAGVQRPTVGILTRLGELVGVKQTRREVFKLIEAKRPEVAHLLKNKCEVHFLGCDDYLNELTCPVVKYIRSTDTAKIVTLGLNDICLDQVEGHIPRIKRDKNFFNLTPELHKTIETVKSNIRTVLEWVGDDDVSGLKGENVNV